MMEAMGKLADRDQAGRQLVDTSIIFPGAEVRGAGAR